MKSKEIETNTPFYSFIIVKLKDSRPSIVGYADNYDDAMTTLIENKMQYHDDLFEIYELTQRKVNSKTRWLIE